MANEPDYYAVLGVSPDSEDVVIQAAYRALMRRYHPDANSSAEAARKAVQINAAYAVLNDKNARAAYDERRKSRTTGGEHASNKPPPPPPPPQGANDAGSPAKKITTVGGANGGLIFAAILTLVIIVSAIGRASGPVSSDNTMNVDENLTTTDMNAVDLNADMNASVELNTVAAEPTDLSRQPQTAVSYDTIEGAAQRVAKIIVTKGIAGARSYSENCHKAVQNTPSWDGADSCAAFDYAAAYIDAAVSSQSGWPRDGYFEFQSSNQPDDYAAVGAASYVTSDRLSKIRDAAQTAAADALQMEIARRKTLAAREQQQTSESENQTQSATGNTDE